MISVVIKMRTKKIALNMISDILPYILIGIVGLIKVRVLISYVGDVGNGYYQVINQIIAYVFLAQAGFGDAVIYALYKPFAKKNKDDINAIYSGSRKIFKIIGLIILGIIFVVSLFLYLFYGFEDGYRNSALICFIVISTSYLISYFGKTQTYMAVLSAAQEKYVYSLVINSIKLLCDILIVIVVMIFKNLESIAIVILIMKILEEFIMRLVVKKKYPWLEEISRKDTSMVKMTKDLVWLQIGYLVLNNIDAILLVAFVGPVMVSIYTSYNFILRYLNEVSSRVELGAVYSFGNVFAKEENDKAYPLFREFLVLFIILAMGLSLTFLLGIRAFVNIWIGKDNYLLNYITIFFFSFTLFLNIIYYPLLALINANGLFKDNKKHIFICATINVVLSLILIKPFGISGILGATAVSFLVNLFLKTKLVSEKIIKEVKHSKLISKYSILIIVFIIFSLLFYKLESIYLSMSLNLITCILLLAITFVIITLITFITLYITNQDTKKLFARVKRLVLKKI